MSWQRVNFIISYSNNPLILLKTKKTELSEEKINKRNVLNECDVCEFESYLWLRFKVVTEYYVKYSEIDGMKCVRSDGPVSFSSSAAFFSYDKSYQVTDDYTSVQSFCRFSYEIIQCSRCLSSFFSFIHMSNTIHDELAQKPVAMEDSHEIAQCLCVHRTYSCQLESMFFLCWFCDHALLVRTCIIWHFYAW